VKTKNSFGAYNIVAVPFKSLSKIPAGSPKIYL
jgi:hypothetical protein